MNTDQVLHSCFRRLRVPTRFISIFIQAAHCGARTDTRTIGLNGPPICFSTSIFPLRMSVSLGCSDPARGKVGLRAGPGHEEYRRSSSISLLYSSQTAVYRQMDPAVPSNFTKKTFHCPLELGEIFTKVPQLLSMLQSYSLCAARLARARYILMP